MTSAPDTAGNVLYYGDNLDILRRYVADESVERAATWTRACSE